MADTVREDDIEAMHSKDEDNGSPQLNATHPASYLEPLKPLKPIQSHGTVCTDEKNTTSDTQPLPSMRLRWQTPMVIAVVCAGGLITSLDAVVVATALPSIASDLSATTSELAWVGSSYLLGSAALQPVWPTLSKIIGRKWALAVGFMLFAAGSLIAALASQANVLIAGRIVQGLGAGNISHICTKIALDPFPRQEREDLNFFGYYTATSVLGAALGPLVGGLMVNYLDWRWCFYINVLFAAVSVPVIVAVFDLTLLSQQSETPAHLGDIDWLGSALIVTATTLGLTGLQLGGNTLSRDSPTFVALTVAGSTATILSLVQQRFTRQPIIPAWMSATRTSIACMIIGFLHGLIYMACIFYIPLYFQLALGASPVQSGSWSLIATLPISFIRGLATFVADRTGRDRTIVWMSASSLALGIGLASTLTSHLDWVLIVWVLLLISAGTAPLCDLPLFILYTKVSRQDRSVRSRVKSAFEFTQNNGFCNRPRGLDTAGIPQDLLDRVAKQVTALAGLESLPLELQEVLRKILTASLSRVWTTFAVAAGVCLFVSFLMKQTTFGRA